MRRSMTVSLLGIIAVALIAFAATIASGNTPRLGLDLQGGASVVLTPVAGKPVAPGAIAQAEKIISRRVDGLGVAEPSITRQNNNIVVELPGVKSAAAAITLVGQTAVLQFRAVQTDQAGHALVFPGPGPAPTPTPSTTTPPPSPTTTVPDGTAPSTTAPATTAPTTAPGNTSTTAGALRSNARVDTAALMSPVPAAAPGLQVSPTTVDSATTAGSPPTTAAAATPPTTAAPAPSASGPPISTADQITDTGTVILPQYDTKTKEILYRYVLGPVLLTGNIVSTARAQLDQNSGTWSVQVNFTGKGGSDFDRIIAKGYYQKQVAIVLDNKVESAPTINAQQFNGVATISGGANGFTHTQASDLGLVLRYGALPVQLTQSDVQTVSATLGKNSLNAGLVAGLIGLALVLLYMLLYYRALGVVVVMGLALSATLLYSIVSYLGVSSLHQSLSLSGVVGIIVSVGVTVDSYIVYFERLKDDIRAGKSIRSSVDKSFARAWRTIWTADLVSIIAALLLFWLTVGAVRGFAFFLGLSTLLDLLVSYSFTRPMVFLLGRNRTFTEARFLGVARGLAAAPAGGQA